MTDGANLPLSFTKGNALLGWRVTFATSARQGRKKRRQREHTKKAKRSLWLRLQLCANKGATQTAVLV